MKGFFRKWPSLAWFGLGSALVITALGWLISIPLFSQSPLQNRVDDSGLIPLLPGVVAEGRLSAQKPGLSKVEIKVATYMRRNTCGLNAELLKDGRVIKRANLRTSWFPDLGWVQVPFYRLGSKLAAGEYSVRFHSPDSGPENAVALAGRTDKDGVMFKPVYARDRVPAWTWLARQRPDYYKLLWGLVLVLTCGGLFTAGGNVLRSGKGKSES